MNNLWWSKFHQHSRGDELDCVPMFPDTAPLHVSSWPNQRPHINKDHGCRIHFIARLQLQRQILRLQWPFYRSFQRPLEELYLHSGFLGKWHALRSLKVSMKSETFSTDFDWCDPPCTCLLAAWTICKCICVYVLNTYSCFHHSWPRQDSAMRRQSRINDAKYEYVVQYIHHDEPSDHMFILCIIRTAWYLLFYSYFVHMSRSLSLEWVGLELDLCCVWWKVFGSRGS